LTHCPHSPDKRNAGTGNAVPRTAISFGAQAYPERIRGLRKRLNQMVAANRLGIK
jgi:hypothetical protein